MTRLKQLLSMVDGQAKINKVANWFPGHMYSGMKAMMGKLASVDCIIEVHDARIPLIGRNTEFKNNLGLIKPHILVLNKADMADLTNWGEVKARLERNGDSNVILSHLKSDTTTVKSGHTRLMNEVVKLINKSDRYNRIDSNSFKVMIVGIPNVGKSTLTNRLRQYHLGVGGEATRTGAVAGVTRTVENKVLICLRPKIYSIDTPGVLEPKTLRRLEYVAPMVLCSTIHDKAVDAMQIMEFFLSHLKRVGNDHYKFYLEIEKPVDSLDDLIVAAREFYDRKRSYEKNTELKKMDLTPLDICWKLIGDFRAGSFGRVMFI